VARLSLKIQLLLAFSSCFDWSGASRIDVPSVKSDVRRALSHRYQHGMDQYRKYTVEQMHPPLARIAVAIGPS
jgi:hypothetical protein